MSKTLGLIFPLIIIVILATAAYQTINGDFFLGAKAGDPCSSYTRQRPLGTAFGIVTSKQDGQFIWNLNGDGTKPKAVVLCARTKITKKFGGSLAYADIKVGDRLELLGWYGDTTQTTVIPAWIRDASALAVTIKATSSPFGVMISGTTSQVKAQTAVKLGAKYYRPISIFLDKWSGSCGECDAAVNAGLKLVLTIRNNGGAGQPSTPPSDLNAFKRTLAQIVDKYKPEVLVIENEENSAAIFYSGTTSQYLQELKAGCEVAHQKGIKCTNGGLVSSLVVVLVADSYKQAGDPNKADEYLSRTLIGAKQAMISQIDSVKGREQLTKGRELLAGYKGAGADFANFHWYIADTKALAEAVTYLRSTSGLPVMTNEVGQQANTDSAQVTSVMQEIKTLGLPYALWFSMDTNPPNGARALNETNSTLRPNGEAYASFIKKNY